MSGGGAGRAVSILFFCSVFGLAPAPRTGLAQEAEEGFVSLFNGTDLTGWELAEGSPLVVREGALVGNPKGPGIIYTPDQYSDFVLRLEFRADRGDTHEANGGVFFRFPDPAEPLAGYEAQISSTDPMNPTGSIYNRVPQSLTLANLVAPEKKWIALEIRCLGPRIEVRYDGNPLQDCTLHEFPTGHIGLQHHHNGSIVEYRNIRIKELSAEDAEQGWTELFDGKSLAGWVASGKATWEVEEGEIVGRGGLGNLYFTKREFADFELRAMARISAKGNSGLIFRGHLPSAAPATFAEGYEYQIDNWDKRNTTGIKNVTGSIYGLFPAPLFTRDDAWFSLKISAVGDHIQTFVNGRRVTDLHDPSFVKGFIALQGYGPDQEVRFRDIFVREVETTP